MSRGERFGEPTSVLDKLRESRVAAASAALALALTGCAATGNSSGPGSEKQPAVSAPIEAGPDGKTLILSQEKLDKISFDWAKTTADRIHPHIENSYYDEGYARDFDGSMIVMGDGDSRTDIRGADLRVYVPKGDPTKDEEPTLDVTMHTGVGPFDDYSIGFVNKNFPASKVSGVTTIEDVEKFFNSGVTPVVAFTESYSDGPGSPTVRTVATIDHDTREVKVIQGEPGEISEGDYLDSDSALEEFSKMNSKLSKVAEDDTIQF